MTQLLTFGTADGAEVVVQVDDGADLPGMVTRGLRDGAVVQRVEQTFDDALSRVQPAVRAMLAQLRSPVDGPDQIEVEFGIQMSAEVGAFVAGASSTANFKVTLTWKSTASAAPTAGGTSHV
ncbi:CU044_2847 family protein [Cellulomonas sp. ICMP 17802]|uniref:CU044_2847 family protein n=1 Tax=Cellulomonas sp. ICMP 17802 TaxID=3239199 RepID=UPI00351BE6F3